MMEFDYVQLGIAYQLPKMWEDRLKRLATKAKPVKLPQTIGHWAEDLLKWKQSLADNDQLSHRTVRSSRQRLNAVRAFMGDETHIKDIITRWREFEIHLSGLKLSRETRVSLRNAAHELANHCVDEDGCSLETVPRKKAKFTESKNKPRKNFIWSKEEFHYVVGKLNDHWKCWLYLMLNCAYTQSDLNTIRHSELRDGRIIRARKKTGSRPSLGILVGSVFRSNAGLGCGSS